MTIRMVASKAAADGLVTSGEPPPPSAQRAAPGIAEPAFAANPYAGVGTQRSVPMRQRQEIQEVPRSRGVEQDEGRRTERPSSHVPYAIG